MPKKFLTYTGIGLIMVLFMWPAIRDFGKGPEPSERDLERMATDEVNLTVKRPAPARPAGDAARDGVTLDSSGGSAAPVEPPSVTEEVTDWVLVVSDRASLARLQAAAAEAGYEIQLEERLLSARIQAPSREAVDQMLEDGGVAARRAPNRSVATPPEPPEPPEGVQYVAFEQYLLEWLGLSKRPGEWGEGVTVAVLDTAFDADNAAFASGQVRQVGEAAASGSHGLAVASIIGGSGEVRGVAPGVEMLSFPVLTDAGGGNSFELAAAIVDAVDSGAQIINLSLGSRAPCLVLESAVDYATRAGAVIVAAVGNDGADGVFWPAADPRTIAVGSVDARAQHLWFSNTGDALDLMAPGLALAAATDGDDAVSLFSGTSASAPVISGLIAGVAAEESISTAEAAELLVAYADEAGPVGSDPYYGGGVVSPVRVLEREMAGIVDVSVPTAWVSELDSPDADAIMHVLVQNRGTETVGSTRLVVSFAGGTQDWTIYDLAPGAAEGREVRVSADYLRNGPLEIRYAAEVTSGETDSRDKNNGRKMVISAGGESPSPSPL